MTVYFIFTNMTSTDNDSIVNSMVEMFKETANEIALEKINDAEARADQLYNDTTSKVNQNLEAERIREEEEIEKHLKIREAQIKNNVKLELLKSQTEAIHEALKETIDKLNKFSESDEYKDLLMKLTAEGLIKLKESRVRIMIRKSDKQLAEEILPEAIKIAKKACDGMEFNVKIDDKRYLPSVPACAGGLILIAQKGKIRLSNVLNDRLRLAYEGLLPQIRTIIMNEE